MTEIHHAAAIMVAKDTRQRESLCMIREAASCNEFWLDDLDQQVKGKENMERVALLLRTNNATIVKIVEEVL